MWRRLPVEVGLGAAPTRDGTLVTAVVSDITQRKRAEDELRSSEARFRQLAENVREVFSIRSADGSRIHYVSPA